MTWRPSSRVTTGADIHFALLPLPLHRAVSLPPTSTTFAPTGIGRVVVFLKTCPIDVTPYPMPTGQPFWRGTGQPVGRGTRHPHGNPRSRGFRFDFDRSAGQSEGPKAEMRTSARTLASMAMPRIRRWFCRRRQGSRRSVLQKKAHDKPERIDTRFQLLVDQTSRSPLF